MTRLANSSLTVVLNKFFANSWDFSNLGLPKYGVWLDFCGFGVLGSMIFTNSHLGFFSSFDFGHCMW